MKILIVDDSSTMRKIVIKSLSDAGIKAEVVEAAGAKEGLQKIAEGGINLVLSDVNMPEITGIEMVKVIRQKFKDLPVIMVTTESSPEMKKTMTDAGANGIITKPFPAEDLRRTLAPFIK
jgi:two-component system chemotaxis response regulator CheY